MRARLSNTSGTKALAGASGGAGCELAGFSAGWAAAAAGVESVLGALPGAGFPVFAGALLAAAGGASAAGADVTGSTDAAGSGVTGSVEGCGGVGVGALSGVATALDPVERCSATYARTAMLSASTASNDPATAKCCLRRMIVAPSSGGAFGTVFGTLVIGVFVAPLTRGDGVEGRAPGTGVGSLSSFIGCAGVSISISGRRSTDAKALLCSTVRTPLALESASRNSSAV